MFLLIFTPDAWIWHAKQIGSHNTPDLCGGNVLLQVVPGSSMQNDAFFLGGSRRGNHALIAGMHLLQPYLREVER